MVRNTKRNFNMLLVSFTIISELFSFDLNSADVNEDSRSSGPGVEQEGSLVCLLPVSGQIVQWFLPQTDENFSLATSVSMSSSSQISPGYPADITMLGALISLLLFNNMVPPNFDSLVLEFLAGDYQLDAIHTLLSLSL